MKYINKLKNFSIPFDYPKFAIVISIAAFGFAASTHDTPCLSAQSTCSVGSDNEFTGNISLKGGTPNLATFDASGITTDQTLTIPNNTGTLALTSDITPPSYTPDAPFLKVDGTGTAVVGSATADAPFVSVDASGQLDSSATLTASTPLKSSASGQITASDLDITTDITPGTALQQIRTNSGGSSVEWFTPAASGGAWTLVDSGTMINASATSTVLSCWYGNTLDPAKRYKFVMDGGTGTNIGVSGYSPLYYPIKNDCSTGTKTYWDSGLNMRNASTHVGVRATSNYQNTSSACFTVQGADANHGSSLASNIEGDIEFSALDNGNDYGFWSQFDMAGTVYSGTSVVGVGIQWGTGSCIGWGTGFTDAFSDITGFAHVLEGGSPAPNNRNWALYEIDY